MKNENTDEFSIRRSLITTGAMSLGFATILATTKASAAKPSSEPPQEQIPVLDVANVIEFGAVGDGNADDTDACVAAIATGRTVYFPVGIYLLSDELILNEGQIIYGDGWNSIIKQTIREKNIFILESFCEIKNLHLVGDGGTTGTGFIKNNGVYANQVGNFKVRNCYIEQCESGGVQARNCHDFSITDNVLFANQWGGIASASDITLYSSGSESSRIIITGNYCLSNNSQGIYIDALGYNSDLIVSNNVCVTLDPATCIQGGAWSEILSGGVRRHGIILGYTGSQVNGPRAVVSNNICRNTIWTGIYKQGISTGPVLITGNVCSNNGYAPSNALSAGIFIHVSGNELIEGNYIYGFQNEGLQGVGGITVNAVAVPDTRSTIKGNVIKDSLSAGICLTTLSSKVDVDSNTILESVGQGIVWHPSTGVTNVGEHTFTGNVIHKSAGLVSSGITVNMQHSTLPIIVERNIITGHDNVTDNRENTGLHITANMGELVQVSDNKIRNFYYGQVSASYWPAARIFDVLIERNHIQDCAIGFDLSADSNTQHDGVVPLVDNTFVNTPEYVGNTIGYPVGRICSRAGDRLIWEQVSTVPAVGTWIAGDRVDFTMPVAGGFMGAVCVESGAPGIWKPYGLIVS